MNEFEYWTDRELRYREAVVYPQAEQRAKWARELRLMNQTSPRARRLRAPVLTLSKLLVSLGELIVAAGERLSPGPPGTRASGA